ncbi:MAG: helix-turn-helix domain-containing protein [Candidatus Omnitrophica bacterium]|nr:helix-turn-helix domain-containing protein [Candidatus Omnitrophota bacterium]
MDENNRLLSCKDLAKFLGVSSWTIYGWVSQKRIPHVKIGRLVRFDEAEILGWLEKQRVKPFHSI